MKFVNKFCAYNAIGLRFGKFIDIVLIRMYVNAERCALNMLLNIRKLTICLGSARGN